MKLSSKNARPKLVKIDEKVVETGKYGIKIKGPDYQKARV